VKSPLKVQLSCGIGAIAAGIALLDCLWLRLVSRSHDSSAKMAPYEKRLKALCAEKGQFARMLAAQEQTVSPSSAWPSMVPNNRQSGERLLSQVKGQIDQALEPREQSRLRSAVWDFFAAGRKGNWTQCRKLYRYLARHSYHFGEADRLFESTVWQPINETFRAYEQLADGEPAYTMAFAHDIIESVLSGSIYFGDTDAGRFLITFLSDAHEAGKPFFSLTQNALADGLYLDYLRAMYGTNIYIPSSAEISDCFTRYMIDAEQRLHEGRLKPGEQVQEVNGRLQISGAVATMELNGYISRLIFDRNPDKDFFVQEAYPQDWMRPFLSPHGPVLKLSHASVPEITEEMVRKDRDYWTRRTNWLIGDWLKASTVVDELTAFVERVYLQRSLSGFTGDTNFVQTAKTWRSLPDQVSPGRWIAGLRTPIARTYEWRARHTTLSDEQRRMTQEAEYAYKQAFALCPYLTDTVVGYTYFLANQNRIRDALLVAQTAAKFYPAEKYYQKIVQQMTALAERASSLP
jgi:hypothetical protein